MAIYDIKKRNFVNLFQETKGCVDVKYIDTDFSVIKILN